MHVLSLRRLKNIILLTNGRKKPTALVVSGLMFIALFLGSQKEMCAQQNNEIVPKKVLSIAGKQIIVTDYDGLKPLFEKKNDSIYMINFWATWCAPCVAELPYFDQLQQAYQDDKLNISLVSLDFSNKLDKSLVPFLNKRKVLSRVLLLDDNDANRYINAIDSSWSGALPATIIYSKKDYTFFEKSFTYEELEKAYLTIKNKKE